ncbi:hypothetical protein HRbin06_00980 [archaeon HR06]|nr:hypothetical protein HRbin06_00980 [archaeon HR06]
MRGGQRLMVNYRNFKFLQEFKASFIKDFKIYMRYPIWIISDFISTPLWFLFFLLALILFTPESSSIYSLEYFFWGYVFVIFLASSMWGIGYEIRTEQLEGTIEQIFLAPINRLTIIIGRWSRTLVMDSLIILYTMLLFKIFSKISFSISNPFLFTFSLILIQISILGLGFFFSGLALKIKNYSSLTTLLFISFTIICGVYFPPSSLPFPLNFISYSLPFTYLVDLLKYSTIEVPTILELKIELPLSLFLSLSSLLLGLTFFKKVERNLRIKGQIGFH